MNYFYRCCLLIMFMAMCSCVQAQETISVRLKEVNLSDAIRMIAKFLRINVLISANVTGTTNLNLVNAKAQAALELLLFSHGLTKWKLNNVWFIAPRQELIQHKQEELKWQELWQETTKLLTEVWTIKYGRAEEIAHIFLHDNLGLLSRRGRISVDQRTNTICIQEIEERMNILRQLVNKLDVPVQQVLIEARLISIDNDYEKELGISFASIQNNNTNNINKAPVNREIGKFNIAVAKLADTSLLDIKLSLLENKGLAELISNPTLFTTNQQTASIEAGEEVPYQEVSESGGTAVVFKKAVLGLSVTPQVLPKNRVLLTLQINQDRPNSKTVLGMPTISTRKIITSVIVKTGQTIVLGGIYESSQEKAEQRMPFLSEIPLLNLLLNDRKFRKNKRELLIFVTPKIVSQFL